MNLKNSLRGQAKQPSCFQAGSPPAPPALPAPVHDDDDDGYVDDGHVDDGHVDGDDHDGKHLVFLPRRQVSVTSQCVWQVAAAKKKWQ